MARPSRWPVVLQAAAEEFRLHGYEGASLESISVRAGIRKGSLYHYIQTKEDLLIAVTKEPAERFFSELKRLEASQIDPVSRLRALFRIQIANFAEYYPAPFVFLQERSRSPSDGQLRVRDRAYADVVEAILSDGVAQELFRLPGGIRGARRFVIGTLNAMRDWFVPELNAVAGQYDALADELSSLVLGGLMAPARNDAEAS